MSSPQLSSGLSPARKLRMALLFMAMLVIVGAFSFSVVEDISFLNALYMTVITLTTVGYGDFTPHSTDSKVLAMGLIILGFFGAAAIMTFLGQFAIETQFRELVMRRKMDNKIKKLTNHYLIAGFGRVGRRVAVEFARRGVPFLIIEADPQCINREIDSGMLFLQGDATDEDVLKQANIDDAHTLISTLPQEAQNVYLTLTARHMNSRLKIIARADFEEGETKLRRAGANHVIIPHILGGMRMAKAALQPNVVDFMEITAMGEEGLGVEELVIPEGSKLVSKALVDSGLKKEYGATIIGIKKPADRMQVNPGPGTILAAGDVLVLLGSTDDLERLSRDLVG